MYNQNDIRERCLRKQTVELLVQIQVPAANTSPHCTCTQVETPQTGAWSLWSAMKTHIEVVMSASVRPVKGQLTQNLSTPVQTVDPDPFTDIKERRAVIICRRRRHHRANQAVIKVLLGVHKAVKVNVWRYESRLGLGGC